MIDRGINPFVPNAHGTTEYTRHKANFEKHKSELERYIENFKSVGWSGNPKTSFCYSLQDNLCSDKCPKSCTDNMEAFICYPGRKIEPKIDNKLGWGGFGLEVNILSDIRKLVKNTFF